MPRSSGSDLEKDLEERLLTLLSMVSDWLKYAEAKNGGILALTAGAAALSLPQIRDTTELSSSAIVVFGLAEGCLLVSATFALASFVPQTNLRARLAERSQPPERDDNLYFFGHLAKYEPAALVTAIRDRYGLPGDAAVESSASHRDLAAQIVANARITLWKLRLFSISVILCAGAVVLFSVGVLVLVI